VGFGLAGGLVMVLAGSRVVEGFLFGVSPHDPLVLVSLPAVLGCIALIACVIPGWRAARIDPTIALRSE
jgi:ABC-type antimicrobial peptide transport system permease subunit